MIDYGISGKPRTLKKATLVKALAYASDYLGLDCDTYVDFTFTKDCGNAYGFALDVEPGEYEIEINKEYPVVDMISTIFHELVHIKQYVRGELVSAEGRKPNYWKGKVCRAKYSDQPWELEAYDLERKMLSNFRRKYKNELSGRRGVVKLC